ncbi:MAG: ImmA/IrrE family metallo-endopeptidase [Flavobacterium sp.]|nr:ImmA/IrrE family metallo-endopeptidase [Flavobacterium sp.]
MTNSTSKNNIKELAEYIALKFNEKSTPLDIIVKQEGLSVFYDNYERGTFDGMTVYDDDSFFIHINIDNGNKEGSVRGRFTLAHELGHYFIDSHRVSLKNGLLQPHPSKTNIKQFNAIEREADYFASCLLMPEEKFKKDIFKKKFSFNLIDHLCSEYNVSRTACAFRFSDIGNHPIMIIYAENGIVKWTHCSNDFPFKSLISNPKVPEDMVMGEYFNKTRKSDIYKTEQIWAIDCFNFVKKEDTQRKFYEHCIPYRDCALSIVWED